MTAPRVPDPVTPIDACVDAFRRHLHMPDPGPVYVTLASVIANRRPGDPVWTLLVGPPGCGKTEVLGTLTGLPDVHPAATLTEAALLSGVPKKDVASGAKGGLLRDIGPFGIIALKDFTSVLSMHREARGAVLSALREVYDGAWTRHVGTDGGRRLHWEGKVGLVAACTPTVDRHHAVMGAMGERFVLYRMPPVDGAEQTRRALGRIGGESGMRADLAAATAAALDSVDLTAEPARQPGDDERLVALADLAVKCRSTVERDGYSREIELVPEAEAPARLALVLRRLLDALALLGVDHTTAWQLAVHIGLGSMAAIRRRVLEHLVDAKQQAGSKTVALAVGYPLNTAKRALEDLAAHGLVTRESGGGNKGDLWELADWTRQRWNAVCEPETSGDPVCEPETSGDTSSIYSPSARTTTNRGSKRVVGNSAPETEGDAAEDAVPDAAIGDTKCSNCGKNLFGRLDLPAVCSVCDEWLNPEAI